MNTAVSKRPAPTVFVVFGGSILLYPLPLSMEIGNSFFCHDSTEPMG